MLARRALAITPDKDFAKTVKLALMAAGTVAESAASPDDLPSEINADLVAIHLPDNGLAPLKALGARLDPRAWVIVILGKHDLGVTVEAMQAIDRVASVLIAERFEPRDLAANVTRLLHGDIFGLEKLIPWGTRIYSTLVADNAERARCVADLSEFAATIGVRRKYREAIELCADEMLMNALYDAPVDSTGRHLFADVPIKERAGMKVEHKVLVQYACDGRSFALSIRDSYGSFARDTLLKFLHKCLHSEQQIDRKVGGAGLGLYLMANNASAILFNLLPGTATEVICLFDVTVPKLQLHHIGVYAEKVDAAGRLVASPTRMSAGVPVERRRAESPSTSRPLMVALASTIVLLLAMIGLVAYPRLVDRTGSLEVVTSPPGARVEIDGRARGTTASGPLVVDGLEADTGHRVVARLDGHADAEALVEVSTERPSVLELSLVPRGARVLIESEPPGATVIHEGRARGATPLALDDLPPGTDVEIALRHPGYRETTRTLRVPAAGGQATLSVSLPISADLASVAITSDPPGALVRQNGERIAGLVTPVAEHLVEAGKKHEFTLELPGHMPETIELEVGRGQRAVPVHAKLDPGGSLTVTANVPARVTVTNTKICKRRALPLECPIENGKHEVKLDNAEPYLDFDVDAPVAGDAVRRDLRFGIIEAREGFKLQAGGGMRSAVALPEGKHQVTLVSAAGEPTKTAVVVRPGATLMVP